jgi:outer membrane protein insertion porin family
MVVSRALPSLLSTEPTHQEIKDRNDTYSKLIIKQINISGNDHIKKEVIINRLPYKVGSKLDMSKRAQAIKNLYNLGYFRQVQLEGEKIDNKSTILHVIVEEKKLLERIDFKGNKKYKTRKLKEKLALDKLTTIDEETIRRICQEVSKAYKEENRHLVKVTGVIVPNKDNPKKASAIFTVKEGPKSTVTRVYFVGNKHIPDRKLRNAVFSRENWLLSFMDSAGVYQDDMVDIDKHRIEYLYRDYGYLMAKVYKAKVDFINKNKEIAITFHIKEGKQFIIRSIHAPGDEIFGEGELLPLVRLEKGKPFSQTKLTQTINRFKELWGEKGYIYADVYPQIKPDEKSNKVDVTFHVERGNKLYVNRINITGNAITRDKVIRRQLGIIEGDLITTKKLSESKSSIEYLSFFEREGVNWKIHRITDDLADLEMNVKEAKTGNLNFMLTYGSDPYSPKPSLKGSIVAEKANLFGLGYDVGGMIQANRHRLQRIEAHIFDPHILDTNVSGGLYGYKRWDEYEFWRNVDKTPIQQVLGGDVRFGFGMPKIDKHLQLFLELGIEDIWNNHPKATGRNEFIFAPIVRRTFQEGTLKWVGVDLVRDTRNHQVYPNKGYRIALMTKTAPTAINNNFSFIKAELEASQYTALIGEDSLVLALHAKAGRISALDDKKVIPYKELFHMGGQSTVRGFTWGGVGPAWSFTGDPLGGRNAVLFNTELIFPLIPDYSMKGHVFYDAGAGWDTPKADLTPQQKSFIVRDKFNLRHSVGIGLNLLKPMPAKIDWGFKLDRKRKEHETPQEFHLSMNYAF